MIKSKITSALTELIKGLSKRPLFCLSLLVLLSDIIYVSFFYTFTDISAYSKENITACGQITQINYNSDFQVESFLLKISNPQKFIQKTSIDKSIFTKSSNSERGNLLNKAGDYLLVYAPKEGFSKPELKAYIVLSGKVGSFKSAGNPGEFDSKKYYTGKRIIASISYPQINAYTKAQNPIPDCLLKVKIKILKSITNYCPLESGTINTLLLGAKTFLPEERKNLYRSVGLSHFLVISGLHIQALGSAIYGLTRKLGLKISFASLLCFGFLIIYSLMVGITPSVFRAVAMFSLQLLATLLKRTYDSLTSMSFSMILSILTNPLNILDTGFIYSYCCVLAICIYILYIHKAISAESERLDISSPILGRIKKNLKGLLSLSACIYMFVLPINLYNNYSSNPFSIVLNLLLSFLSLPAILSALGAMIFSLLKLSFPAGLMDFIFALILRFMDYLCEIFDSLNAFKIIGKPEMIRIMIYYILIIIFLIFFSVKSRIYTNFIFALFLFVLLTIRVLPHPVFYMLDVGQGDCMVVQYSTKDAIIIDAGSSSKSSLAQNIIIPFLLSKGIRNVSDIYISHSDADHCNAVSDLLLLSKSAGIKINQIILPVDFDKDKAFESTDPNLDLNQEIKNSKDYLAIKNTKTSYISSGNIVTYPNLQILCLWPKEDSMMADTNADSMVLLASHDDFDIIFCADIPMESEAKILDYLLPRSIKDYTCDNKIEVYKVAHHGSKGSSSEEFLNDLLPKYSFISAGKNNTYGHPSKETLSRLQAVSSRIFRTDLEGCLQIEMHN